MSDTNDRARSASTITLTAPTGFEFLVDCYGKPAFAYPKDDEFFLTDMGGVLQKDNFVTWREKRFILKKKVIVVPGAQQYPKCIKAETVAAIYGGDVTIPDGWTFVDFRPVALGESFLDSARPSDVIEKACPTCLPRIIVKRA